MRRTTGPTRKNGEDRDDRHSQIEAEPKADQTGGRPGAGFLDVSSGSGPRSGAWLAISGEHSRRNFPAS